MKEKDAKKLVEETFSGKYDNDKFCIFINQLAGHASNKLEWRDKSYAGNSLPQSHQESIESYKYLCRFVDGADEIGVFAVKLDSIKTLERARSFQRSFIARQMEKFNKDAALAAFYTGDEENLEWRFSLVQMHYKLEKGKVKKELTPVHRSSFLVGDTILKHTTERQLITLLLSSEPMSLAVLEEAFSVEPVTNEFFKEYKRLYEKLLSHLQERMDSGLQFTRECEESIENLEYEQEEIIEIKLEDFAKRLLGQLVFLYFLQKKRLLGAPEGKRFDKGEKNFIQNLYKKGDFNNFYDDKLTYLLHHALATDRYKESESDYYELFDCKIPYLNGGLFEPFAGYNWRQPLNISNDIFKEIFKVFDTYNFTVHEDEPLENEVAVDPEMLGKIFEDLIPDNERKGSGTFYTPREIVYYMCQESLIDYLHGYFKDSKTLKDISHDDIEEFVIYCDTMQEYNAVVQEKREKGQDTKTYKEFKIPDSIKQSAQEVDKALQDVRICDPAIGSGAFPVAMMLEITRLRIALDKAFLCKKLSPYKCKRHCVENCLYGVDLESSAVDIARLRFWLSLTIEKEKDDRQPDRVAPLPNLDYKIIEGNTLLRKHSQQLFSPTLRDLEKSKGRYFSEGNKDQKLTLKENIEAEIKDLLEDDYDLKLLFSEIFHEDNDNSGFDIILANPPYIQLQKDRGKIGEPYIPMEYDSFVKTGDIYMLFYERAIELLKDGGRLAYITSNKWMTADYGKNLRKFFAEEITPIALVDLGANVFKTATVDSNILIARKGKPSSDMTFRAATLHDHKNQDLYQYMQDEKNVIDMLLPKNDEQWRVLSQAERVILQKIESKGKKIKERDDINIFRGIITGYDEAFIIDNKTRKKLIDKDPNSKEYIKPVLRGRDIKRWHSAWQGKWLIATLSLFNIDIDNYPAIKEHFINFGKEKLEQTGAIGARSKSGYKWFETQRPARHYKEFEKGKIIYPELNQNCSFVYDIDNYYLSKTAYIMTSDSVNLKNLTAFLNSNIGKFWFLHSCVIIGKKGICMFSITMNELPIYERINDCHELGEINDAITKGEDIQMHEARLNQILYKLYDLTKDEIKILEEAIEKIAN